MRKEKLDVNKVFYYELRRTVCSRFFVGLTAVTLWYGRQILTTSTILGVAHTAPFSPWSFGSYLAALMPLLNVSLLFFLWNLCNHKARLVETLVNASSPHPRQYRLIKCCAAAAAWMILALLAAALGAGFLLNLFGPAVPLAQFPAPAALVLLPSLVFVLGTGLLVGRIHPGLLFVMMALVFGWGFVPFPMAADLYRQNLFTRYPMTLPNLDPAFTVPSEAVIGSCLFILAGAAALAVSMHKEQ